MSHEPLTDDESWQRDFHVSPNDMRLINEMAKHLLNNAIVMVARTLQFGGDYEQTVGMTEHGVFNGQDEQIKIAVRVEVMREGNTQGWK